jgi:hypothetical protein
MKGRGSMLRPNSGQAAKMATPAKRAEDRAAPQSKGIRAVMVTHALVVTTWCTFFFTP